MLKKQIYRSYIYKLFSMIISFIIISININFLGLELFGVWSVILAFIQWIVFFDFGIGNGLKNKISEALTLKKIELVNQYISTAYFSISILILLVGISLYILTSYINWNNLLNTDYVNLHYTINIIIIFTLIHFITSLINHIVIATHNASISVLNQFLFQFINLILVLLYMTTYDSREIYILAYIYGVAIIVGSLIISVYFYSKNKEYIPQYKNLNIKFVKPLLTLGIKFFILQLAILVIYTSDKIIITNLLGPIQVSTYEIVQKYFSVVIIIHTIINTPLWPFYKKCYIENDYSTISKTLKKMMLLFIGYSVLILIMILVAKTVIPLWINQDLGIQFSTYYLMGLLTLVLIWYTIFAYFSNGIDKTNIQLYSSIIGAIINIPLSILFLEYFHLGINGVIIATIVSLSIFAILGPIQALYIIRQMRKIND